MSVSERPKLTNFIRIFAGALLVLTLSGCASGFNLFGGGEAFIEEELVPPEQLYAEGVAYVNKGRIRSAISAFEKLERQHPYSSYTPKAQLMTVFGQYRRNAFEDTITAADRFISLNPSSPEVPYAMFLRANSYYHQIKDATRDQQASVDAINKFEEIIARFPESEYAEESRERILVATDQLAGKEMSVGRYYLGQKDYGAAINRFREVVENHETSTHIEEALMRLTETYLALGLIAEAQTAAAVLGHNYPAGEWYKDAYELLDSQGLRPEIKGRSWLQETALKTQ